MPRRCPDCRKNDVLDSVFDKIRLWIMWRFFGEDVSDLKQASFTQGFSDGYLVGAKNERENRDRIEAIKQGESPLHTQGVIYTTSDNKARPRVGVQKGLQRSKGRAGRGGAKVHSNKGRKVSSR